MLRSLPRSASPGVNPWAVVGVLSLGTFMTLLDNTIVNIAIPSMVDSLRASLDQVLWVLNAYSLLFAVLLITSGRLGDIFGPRNLFAAGMVVFTIASALSGLAHTPLELILARAAQGLGAALIAPQGLPFVTSLFAPERRAGPFAFFGILAGLAVVLGPVVGGIIVTHWGWRWIFYVNLPFGVATLALAFLLMPDIRPGRNHRLDIRGVALATAGLFGVIFGLIEGQRYHWGAVYGSITIPVIIGIGVALLAVFLWTQYRQRDGEPLLPLSVFRDRNYTVVTFVLAAMGFCMLGLFLPLTIYLQSVLHMSALTAALTTAPMSVTMLLVSPLSNTLVGRVNGKYILMAGLTLFAAGMGYIDWRIQVDAARWSFLPGLIVAGVGMAGVWGPAYNLATRNLTPQFAGVASGLLNTLQELGVVTASASVGALLQNRLATALRDQAIADAAQLPQAFRAPFVAGFSNAASGGLEVGAGQTGAPLELPAALPAPVVQQIQHLAAQVFDHAFVAAARPTLLLPLVIILLAALSCAALQGAVAGEPVLAPETPAPDRALVGVGER